MTGCIKDSKLEENARILAELVKKDKLISCISKRFDDQVLGFMAANKDVILKQVKEDKDYALNVSECPTVPSFDNYLLSLEEQVKKYLVTHKQSVSLAADVIDRYKTRFYYSALPNIMESSYRH